MSRTIELKPIRESLSDYDEIEELIRELFKKEIYIPLLKEASMRREALLNSKDDLLKALQSGRLTFHRGKISGNLNSTLSKELRALGATWDRKQKCYSILLKDLPMEVRSAISSSAYKFQERLHRIDEKLSAIVPEELASKLKVSDAFDRSLWKIESEFKKSVKNITVSPTLTPSQAQRISDEYQTNMSLWIKDFTQGHIQKLRSAIQKSSLAGNRYESMMKTIQTSYGVSERKATFLARQETSLFMTKFKEVRYQDAGVHEYKWRSVLGTPAHPVRPMHKELDTRSREQGEIFRFDTPPIDDPNGSRHNPGQNFGCRCVAVAVVRFKK